MRKLVLLSAVLASAVAVTGCASGGGYGYTSAREECLRDRDNNRVAGTVVGAGVGALAGSAIAGNSSNTAGAVVGGIAGAVVGNQLAKSDRPCPRGYRYR